MKIGIDARLINETGVGRYIRNLVYELTLMHPSHTFSFVIFLPSSTYDSFVLPNENWEKRKVDVHWHTVLEQIVMPFLFFKEHLDLIHIPYFNIPILYPKKYIVTVHDLTILHVATGKASTRPGYIYALKRLGYQIVLRFGLRRAAHIIAVSETVKKDIIQSLHIHPDKISVTYEGIDAKIHNTQYPMPNVKRPYFLYVGNAYPHKNLEFLIRSFAAFTKNQKSKKQYLVLVGKDDFFYKRLRIWVNTLPCAEQIIFLNAVDDELLAALYTHATASVFPSLAEGFGLPILESITFGCPVICSDIPVFHELFGDIPTFVNPNNQNELSAALGKSLSQSTKKISQDQIEKVKQTYQWSQTAKQTLAIYQHV
jgi:glycosyltransferase involved in cell wall biosynthesis